MLVDPEPPSFTEAPLQSEIDPPLEASMQAPTEPMQDNPSPPRTLPSHRARVAKPLVKMVDDFTPLEGAISAKARLQRNGTSEETPVAGPSSSPRGSSRKPGPGRSSTGMLNKHTSSLLTFEKGALKTVKGKFTAPVDEGNAQFDDSDAMMASSGVPPTSDELLKLGGFDSTAAEALDDFEDEDVVSSPAEAPESNANQQRFF
jgi:hypothetical protein